MATDDKDKKISEFELEATLDGNELVPIVKDGTNYKTTLAGVRVGLATEGDVANAVKDAEAYTDKKAIETIYDINNHDFVDMGEAGIWAACNIGATKPTEAGLYFAWAEAQGFADASAKGGFSWGTYKYGSGANNLTKYNFQSNRGVVDNLGDIKVGEDDAAHIQLGGAWHMPSRQDYRKLIDACDTEFTWNYNGTGVSGRIFRLKTDPRKELFFPAVGYIDNNYKGGDNEGYYWTSWLKTDLCYTAYDFMFGANSVSTDYYDSRYTGCPIRAFIATTDEKFLRKKDGEERFEAIESAQTSDLAKITELQGKLNGVSNVQAELNKKQDKGDYATRSELSGLATKSDLGNYATRSDLDVIETLTESINKGLGETIQRVDAVEKDKADKDGNYPELISGAAYNLEGLIDKVNDYAYCPVGNDSDVKNGTAEILNIKGNAIAWNQLLSLGDIDSSFYENRYGISVKSTGNNTIKLYGDVTNSLGGIAIGDSKTNAIAGHKYLCRINSIKKNSDNINCLCFYFKDKATNKETIQKGIESHILTIAEEGEIGLIITISSTLVGTSIDVTYENINFFDLTLIYGAGNEPTTAEQFEEDYQRWFGKPLEYEEHDEGSIRNVQATGIKTVGFNQYENGRAKVIGGKEYQITGAFSSLNMGGVNIEPDSSGKFTPSTTGEIEIVGGDDTTCIHLVWSGKRNGDYEPYWEQTKPLPLTTLKGRLNGEGESVVVFPDGLKRAGNIYDEIKVENGVTKAVKRVQEMHIEDMELVYTLYDEPEEYILDDFSLPLAYKIDDFGTEQIIAPENSIAPTLTTRYGINAVDTIRRLPDVYLSKKEAEATYVKKGDTTKKAYEFTIPSSAIEQARENSSALVTPTFDGEYTDVYNALLDNIGDIDINVIIDFDNGNSVTAFPLFRELNQPDTYYSRPYFRYGYKYDDVEISLSLTSSSFSAVVSYENLSALLDADKTNLANFKQHVEADFVKDADYNNDKATIMSQIMDLQKRLSTLENS